MNVNNDFSIKGVKIPSNLKLPKIPDGYSTDSSNGIVLPDIRSNQILLPNNKVYDVTSSKRASETFNSQNITIEVPDSYKKVDAKDEKPMTVTARNTFKRAKVAQYEDTKNGANIIRVTKNVFAKDGALKSAEVMEINTKNPRKSIRYIKDYEHNSETEIKVTMPFKPRLTKNDSMTTIYRNNEGKIIKTEEYTKSAVEGIYDISETDAAGNKTIISKTSKDNQGNILIEKNLTSLDGTKTEYRFESDKDGNHKKLFTQITDKDGNVLSTIDRTYDKESKDVTYSSVNGHKFKAERNGENISITDYVTGKITVIDYESKTPSDDDKDFATMLSEKKRTFSNENVLDTLLDTLPADALLTLDEKVKKVIPLKDELDSAFNGLFGILLCKTDNFIVNHELGHSLDFPKIENDENLIGKDVNLINGNIQFQKAYIEEKAAFLKEFPDFKEKFVDYFLTSPEKNPQAGKKELVAESNAINGLQPAPPEVCAMRTTLLQRYFPRSIAELTKLMNPIALSENVFEQLQQEKQ